MIKLDKGVDGLWQVTINRPDKANYLTREMLNELADIAEAATESRAFVLTGEGKVFSAGMDLEAAKTGLATDPVWERLSGAIAALPGLSIAALNGTVAGGAIGMVLACDLRVAVPSTKIFYPVMRLGFLPQPSDPGRLRNLIGPSRAKMILMAGQKIEAEQALHWGLFDQVVEKNALLETARGLATDTLAASIEHATAIKAL
ncbi:MAG: enoyl-CoA hydratase/isomerase family protein [Pseudomonadota bacterium]